MDFVGQLKGFISKTTSLMLFRICLPLPWKIIYLHLSAFTEILLAINQLLIFYFSVNLVPVISKSVYRAGPDEIVCLGSCN